MSDGTRGRIYGDGETIVNQGDVGDCLYVVRDGEEVVELQARFGSETPT